MANNDKKVLYTTESVVGTTGSTAVNKQELTSTVSTAGTETNELPQNVSEFINDAKYISKNDLDAWLSEHSYIKKEEIKTYIEKSNIVILNTIKNHTNKQVTDLLNQYDTKLKKGLQDLNDLGIEKGFITADKEKTFATKSDIQNIEKSIKNVNSSITGLDDRYLTEHQSLDGYATESWVKDQKYLTKHQNLSGYAKKSEIPSLKGFATEKWVESKGYITEHQDLSEYAKKDEVPSIEGFAKKSELKSYALNSDVYTKAEVNSCVGNMLPKSEAESKYLTKNAAQNTYVTKILADNKYLAIEDYRGFRDATVISSKYTDSTIEQLTNDKDSLRNGFYIVNKTDIVIVKDHEIINMFKDGVIHGIDGKNGADGKSAYELYCDTVPEGETPMSKEEWLKSFNPISNYEIYADNERSKGNEPLSKDDWLKSLKAESNYDIYCDTVPDGETPLSEEKWLETLKGADGKSAYELYKESVSESEIPMTKDEWLESLKVAKLTWKEI